VRRAAGLWPRLSKRGGTDASVPRVGGRDGEDTRAGHLAKGATNPADQKLLSGCRSKVVGNRPLQRPAARTLQSRPGLSLLLYCCGTAAVPCRWKEEKVLRVWTPPGFSAEDAPPGGWPVLYMCDGERPQGVVASGYGHGCRWLRARLQAHGKIQQQACGQAEAGAAPAAASGQQALLCSPLGLGLCAGRGCGNARCWPRSVVARFARCWHVKRIGPVCTLAGKNMFEDWLAHQVSTDLAHPACSPLARRTWIRLLAGSGLAAIVRPGHPTAPPLLHSA
jgi:hypothetical protein